MKYDEIVLYCIMIVLSLDRLTNVIKGIKCLFSVLEVQVRQLVIYSFYYRTIHKLYVQCMYINNMAFKEGGSHLLMDKHPSSFKA